MHRSGIQHFLCALQRYFFVKAPSRMESTTEVARATGRLDVAVGRLEMELSRLDNTVRHPQQSAEGMKR
jgi:hypothetical protein